jgi:hypothetical protein
VTFVLLARDAAARSTPTWDELAARLNDPNLHVVDVRQVPASVEVRFNPVAYSAGRVAARIRACGYAVAEILSIDSSAREATRNLWGSRL